MSNAAGFRKLAQEIENGRNARGAMRQQLKGDIIGIRDKTLALKRETHKFMDSVAGNRAKRSSELKTRLNQTMGNIKSQGKERIKTAARDKQDRVNYTAGLKADFKKMQADVNTLINFIRNENSRMKSSLNADLKKYISELADGVDRLKNDTDGTAAARRQEVGQIKETTRELLEDCRSFIKNLEDTSDMVRQRLVDELSSFKSDLKRMGEARKAQNIPGKLKEEHQAIASSVAELRRDINAMHTEMKNGIRSALQSYTEDLKSVDRRRRAETAEFLNAIKADIRNAADVWQEVTGLRSREPAQTPFAPEPSETSDPEAEPVTGAGEDPEPVADSGAEDPVREPNPANNAPETPNASDIPDETEAMEVSEAPRPEDDDLTSADLPEEEDLTDEELESAVNDNSLGDIQPRLVELLQNHGEGLKMTQLAQMLDLDQWRVLIPVMRDLLDKGEIRKEGAFYYT